ncbi:hypothetical protein AAVH_36197 [Aphelenchoides avenae]|nr:hypothetical protein AAVH_36197 [Aphelenchus avenae]
MDVFVFRPGKNAHLRKIFSNLAKLELLVLHVMDRSSHQPVLKFIDDNMSSLQNSAIRINDRREICYHQDIKYMMDYSADILDGGRKNVLFCSDITSQTPPKLLKMVHKAFVEWPNPKVAKLALRCYKKGDFTDETRKYADRHKLHFERDDRPDGNYACEIRNREWKLRFLVMKLADGSHLVSVRSYRL